MSTLCIHKDIKEIVKRTVLWTVLLFFSSHAYSSAHICASDTLIIDGVTIGVEIEEVSEDSVLVESVDSIPDIKSGSKLNLNLGISYKYGLGSAAILKESELLDVDDFIDDSSVPLKFQSITLNSEVYRNRGSAWEIGISHTTWNQKLTKVESEVLDSTWFFYSSSESDLFQVERFTTEFGFEYDTLEMRLTESAWSQKYIEIPITYLQDVYSTKNDFRFSLGLSAIPSYTYKSHQGLTTLLEQRDLVVFNARNETSSKFNFSGEIEARASKLFFDQFHIILNVGFRNNFSGMFSSESPIELKRNAVFASAGIHYFFK